MMTEDEEKQFKQELLMADLNLRRKQDLWETPRNIAILAGAVAAIAATVGGLAGYKIGTTPTPNITINVPPPTVIAPK
jgi:hypothetical protein